MFLPNWSVKAEALYYDLGRNNNNNARLLAITCNGATCAVPEGLFASSLITQNSNRSNGVIACAGINYHLNWDAPAPVVTLLIAALVPPPVQAEVLANKEPDEYFAGFLLLLRLSGRTRAWLKTKNPDFERR